jgi:hypothetical protein
VSFVGPSGPTGAAGGEAYRYFCVAGAATTSDRFIEIRGQSVQTDEIRSYRKLQRAGTFTALRVYFTVAYSTATATVAVRIEGSDTVLIGTIAPGAQTLLVTGSVPYSAGNKLSVRITLSSAEANAGLGVSVVVY